MRNDFAYQGFRVGVTCRRIEEIDAVVQGFVQDSRGSGYVAAHLVLAGDFRQSKSKGRDLQAGLAEFA